MLFMMNSVVGFCKNGQLRPFYWNCSSFYAFGNRVNLEVQCRFGLNIRMRMVNNMSDRLYVGIDLGTYQSTISSSAGASHTIETIVGLSLIHI